MNKNDFWDMSRPSDGPILDAELIAYAEKVLNVRLPILLIDLLKIKNGGSTRDFALPTTIKTCLGDSYLRIDELYGIGDDHLSSKANLLHSAYLIKEWGLPDKQVLLLGDGHWWITLDYRNGAEPTVNWIDVENEQDFLIAPTFNAFVNSLESLDKYEPTEKNDRVTHQTIMWENFLDEEKLAELGERFLTDVNERRRKNGLPDIQKK
ncbi:SMI1/KNR4 family protein [Pedobacter caeni]|uniref:SMI1 / KNR4 family (SUKH-1) n=1 Tax=Pedobacter caeni TaxID=288992 RepID=A0A1M4UCT8_9SPHI|nr:SMI1/KNR4 family protein [Pedobacter caeni]SHE54417.1 SMI1 / KNR4 family (SUKH-1) [Pedobacter caeni]